MKTVEDFFEKYKIDSFYHWQDENDCTPIKPFDRNRHKKLSFGIIPGFRNYDLFYERYLSAVNILKENGFIKQNIKILDIGSGEGFFKFFFDAMVYEKIQWHGVEVWKERIEFCKHIGYNIEIVNMERDNLPYSDEYFDIVLASHVLEHLPNPERIIKEMGRVLKKGGALLIGTPTKPTVIASIDSYLHKINNRNLGDTQQAFTHNSLEKLILDSLNLTKETVIDKRGFRIISGRKLFPFENWKWFYNISVLLGRKLLAIVPEVNVIIRK